MAIQAEQIAEQSELLKKRKKTLTGKRFRLEGVSVYSTAEVLHIAHEDEARIETKSPRVRPPRALSVGEVAVLLLRKVKLSH
ncbi:hypothetical protein K3495_g5011 [Podosphaera aphanis]|nr:hypothetical protein K3495_g5011 [Podosphaera aphanis]